MYRMDIIWTSLTLFPVSNAYFACVFSDFRFSDRVIAMGYPSENVESIYRNPLEEVRRLLEERHKVLLKKDTTKGCLKTSQTSRNVEILLFFKLKNIRNPK